jgi:hypothetical protein
MLRTGDGHLRLFSSDEMKKRAIRKQDVGGLLKNADLSGSIVTTLLVDGSGL